MRLVGSDNGLKEVEVGGRVIPRHKDGTFHVDGAAGQLLKASGDFAVAGTTFTRARGYRCNDCGFMAVFRDHCGRCDGTSLTPEYDEVSSENETEE